MVRGSVLHLSWLNMTSKVSDPNDGMGKKPIKWRT